MPESFTFKAFSFKSFASSQACPLPCNVRLIIPISALSAALSCQQQPYLATAASSPSNFCPICRPILRTAALSCQIDERRLLKVTRLTPLQVDLLPQPSTLNPQPSTTNPLPSTLSPQLSTLSPQPSTLNPQPSTLNPRPSTLNPTGVPRSKETAPA